MFSRGWTYSPYFPLLSLATMSLTFGIFRVLSTTVVPQILVQIFMVPRGGIQTHWWLPYLPYMTFHIWTAVLLKGQIKMICNHNFYDWVCLINNNPHNPIFITDLSYHSSFISWTLLYCSSYNVNTFMDLNVSVWISTDNCRTLKSVIEYLVTTIIWITYCPIRIFPDLKILWGVFNWL